MSESELLMIGISMILAAGLIKCVEGLYHATTSQQSYWIPQVLLWSSFIYGVCFLWGYKDNLSENPSFILYASSVAVASTFVLRAHILATNEAAQIEDWANHFNKVARPYFVVAALTSLSTLVAASSHNEAETTGFDAVSIPFWLGAVLNTTGANSEKVWVRGAVAVTLLILTVLAAYVLLSNDMV
jgi:hypothetical protein